MKRQFNDFLNDILFEIEIIEKATIDLTLNEFKNDIVIIRAVTKSLEIIGEAVSNVPNEIREKYGEVEWRRIKGFRDVVTHQYWNIDLTYEWNIIKTKLTVLKNQIKEIIEKESETK